MLQNQDIDLIERDLNEFGLTTKNKKTNGLRAIWPNYNLNGYPSIDISLSGISIDFRTIMFTKSYTIFHRLEFLEFANRLNYNSTIAQYIINGDVLYAMAYMVGNYEKARFYYFYRMWEEDMEKISKVDGKENFLVSFQPGL